MNNVIFLSGLDFFSCSENRPSFLGYNIAYKDKVLSTQLLAHEWARKGAIEGSVVLANEQTQGKGKLNRVWLSPKDSSISMSLILRPNIDLASSAQITLLASIAVYNVLTKIKNIDLQIKWPNDILINKKKVCGILSELKISNNKADYIILGIGLNVNQEEIPDFIQKKASSLYLETGTKLSIKEIIIDILYELEKVYVLYLNKGFKLLKSIWEEKSNFIGENVRLKQKDNVLTGTVLSLNNDGFLLINTDQGDFITNNSDIEII